MHGVMPPHYLHELPAGDEERLEKIFNKLDMDGNGRIDVHDLSKALHDVGVHKRYAEVKFDTRLFIDILYVYMVYVNPNGTTDAWNS